MTFVELKLSKLSCEASHNRAMLQSAEICHKSHTVSYSAYVTKISGPLLTLSDVLRPFGSHWQYV
jgi:hypothetical protein